MIICFTLFEKSALKKKKKKKFTAEITLLNSTSKLHSEPLPIQQVIIADITDDHICLGSKNKENKAQTF